MLQIPDFEHSGYLGNELIKEAGVQVPWTKDMLVEFNKCKADPLYFAEKYIHIVHVDHGIIPIELYPYQRRILKDMHEQRRVSVVTARQAGKTTTAVCFILHHVLFNRYKRVALLADKEDTAKEILSRIKDAYEHLPLWIQQGVVKWNETNVDLENGSKIYARATGSKSIRGKSCSMVYIDEAAHVENWSLFLRAVLPTISSGKTTKMLLTSTPNGLNHFYKTCHLAQKRGTDEHSSWNGYYYHKVMWYDVPGRDQAWKDNELGSMDFDLEMFAQEQECEFLGSSGTLITGSKLKQLVAQKPIYDKNNLRIYFKPEDGHKYVIICDVSRGKGLDASAFSVIDITKMPYNQVAVFRSNMITPRDYAQIIHQLGLHYNGAQVMVEINDIGEQVSCTLFDDYEYENVLCTETAGRAGRRLCNFTSKGDKGIRTTKTVKAVGCSALKLLIEQNQLIINDWMTITELSTFSQKGNSYEAEQDCHDDIVAGLFLFAWLTTQKFFKELTDINTMNNLRDSTEEQMMEELTPFGIVHNAADQYMSEDTVMTSKGDAFLMFDEEPYDNF